MLLGFNPIARSNSTMASSWRPWMKASIPAGPASVPVVRIDRERLPHEFVEPLEFVRHINAEYDQSHQSVREKRERAGIAGIETQRLFAEFEDFRMLHGVCGVRRSCR